MGGAARRRPRLAPDPGPGRLAVPGRSRRFSAGGRLIERDGQGVFYVTMIRIIRNAGMGADGELRMIRQRRAIRQVVNATKCHPTAEEVYRRVRYRLPRIGLATVYRNLERPAEVGALQRLESGRGQMRFESRPEPNAHVRCMRCGCVREALLPAPERFPRSWRGFHPGNPG